MMIPQRHCVTSWTLCARTKATSRNSGSHTPTTSHITYFFENKKKNNGYWF